MAYEMKDKDNEISFQNQADTNNVNFTDIIEKIKNAGKCPVCMVLAKPPTLLCQNGHIMCKDCVSSLSECPLCSEPFSNIISSVKLVALDNILNELPRICDNDIYGCNYVYTTKVMLIEHKYSCDKRIVICRVVDCEWQGGYNGIKKHVQDVHKRLLLTNGSEVMIKYKPDLNIVYPIFLNKFLVWKRVAIDPVQKVMYIMLESCSAHIEEIKPILVYTVRGLKSNFKYTCSNYAWKDDDIKLVDKKVDTSLATIPRHMAIPLYMLDHVKDDQDFITYKFKIKKLQYNSLKVWNNFSLFLIMIILCLFLMFYTINPSPADNF